MQGRRKPSNSPRKDNVGLTALVYCKDRTSRHQQEQVQKDLKRQNDPNLFEMHEKATRIKIVKNYSNWLGDGDSNCEEKQTALNTRWVTR
eukprot:1862345-Amphidinium_carterae.1